MVGNQQQVINGKKQWVMVAKVLMSITINDLHNLMIKPVSKGGFVGAWDASNNNVRFGMTTLRRYKPSHLRVMTDADKLICGCEPCGKTDDLNEAYNAKCTKIVALAEIALEEMNDDDPEKKDFETRLTAYKEQIFCEDGSHRHKRGWDAIEL